MINPEYLTRQAELISDDDRDVSIAIIGAGAIGSFTALSLAKMGFINLAVYDYDSIDAVNMNCQFYRTSDIGKQKVVALAELVKDFTDADIDVHDKQIQDGDFIKADIVISAVDSIQVRKIIFDNSACKWFIDPRMGAEYANLRTVDMFDSKTKANYAKSLYASDEVEHERCTAKATMYTVNLLAGQVVKTVKDLCTNHDHIMSMQWNIETNRLVAFSSSGERL